MGIVRFRALSSTAASAGKVAETGGVFGTDVALKLKGRGVFGNGEGGKGCTVPGSAVDARDDADSDDAVLGNGVFESGPDGNLLAWGVPGGKFPDGIVPF